MANLTPSFRFPAKLPADTAHPKVIDAIEQNTNGLVDVNQAIVALNSKVSALTPTTSTTSGTASSGSTTVVESGVSSFNAETGGVVYFPSMGLVNNQSGVTAYTTQTQDNGAIVVLASASAIAVTLNFNVAAPWFTTISNQGTSTITITPSSGLVNGAASATLNAGNFSTIFFDGKNWWSDAPTSGGGGGVTQIIAGANVTISPVGGTGAVTVNASGTSGTAYTATLSASTLPPGSGITSITGHTAPSTAILLASLYDPTSPGANQYLSAFAYSQNGTINYSVFNVSSATVTTLTSTVINIRVIL